MYGVNASVPKTLVRHLVRYYADTCKDEKLTEVLLDILDTPVSPELLPPKDGKIAQKTEDLVGPYELHDFYLYYMLRAGFEPEKIYSARRACIHRLERFVQSLDLFRRHAGEFAHIRHFAFHVRITLYSPPAGNGQAGYRGHGHRKGASPVVHFFGEPGPQRLMFFHRTLYGVQFPLHRFDFFYLGIPCGRSPLDIVELLPEGR